MCFKVSKYPNENVLSPQARKETERRLTVLVEQEQLKCGLRLDGLNHTLRTSSGRTPRNIWKGKFIKIFIVEKKSQRKKETMQVLTRFSPRWTWGWSGNEVGNQRKIHLWPSGWQYHTWLASLSFVKCQYLGAFWPLPLSIRLNNNITIIK